MRWYLAGLILSIALFALESLHGGSLWLVAAYAFAIYVLISRLEHLRQARWAIGSIGWFSALAVLLWSRTEGVFRDIGYAIGSDRANMLWLVAFSVTAASGAVAFSRRARFEFVRWRSLAVLLLLALVLCAASSSKGGAGAMVEFFMRQFRLDQATAEVWVIAVRKAIHFSYYGLLGLAAWASAKSGSLERPIGWAIFFALTCATFDELRQTTQPGRTGSTLDVLLDVFGAAVCIWIGSLIEHRARIRAQGEL